MSLESHKNRQTIGTGGAKNHGNELSRAVQFESEQKQLNHIQARIRRLPGSAYDLDTLVKAGADQEQILRLLALEVFGHETGWQRAMRRKRDEFRSLARRFKAVTAEAERLAEDPAPRQGK